VKLDDAITVVRELRRYRYRNCKAPHPRGAFIRNMLLKHATLAEFDHAIEAEKNPCGKMVWVEITDLRVGQRCLGFRRLLIQLRRYPLKKVPIVVRLPSGLYYLWDGNHRATAAALLGKRRIKCLLVGKSEK
jgi:hypothetical protein